MLDFMKVGWCETKKGYDVFPIFDTRKCSDLMIRGSDFYAIWDEDRKMWSRDEDDAIRLIDREMERYVEENRNKFDGRINILYMWNNRTGTITNWHTYCQKQRRDSFHMLDEKLIFSDTETKKDDYASKRLSYPLTPGDYSAWDKIIGTLYSPEERHKIEWAIGSIVTGDSKELQKFLVLYGAPGTGKGTILKVIRKLFDGYVADFSAQALGSSSSSFALEAFASNPLVAIQEDGNLSRIEDNTRLNSLVSHEYMVVNEKFKSTYSAKFKCFLFMGTNHPVKITDAKSGLLRRLIDVSPSGNKIEPREYRKLTKQVSFELGAIACHCRDVYLEDPDYYDSYIPTAMLGASNDFYNFVIDSYSVFLNENGTTLKSAWERYKLYCEDAKVPYPMTQRVFKEELKNYFDECVDRVNLDGSRVRNYYRGFRIDKFETEKKPEEKNEKIKSTWLNFESGIQSKFNILAQEYPAQYASEAGTPSKKWSDCGTLLKDISTDKLHYVKVPENHIVIDFDIKNENGEKDYDLNLAAASMWPRTYAELSKSGAGIHLHYIYSGDVSALSRIYDENVEIKVFTGNSSLRRKLTKCNDIDISTISSGLPLKGVKMVNKDIVQSERGLRTTIKRCLNKEIHPSTKSNVDFIFKILEDAYKSDLKYDVSDMKNAVFAFAAQSTNQANTCIKLVNSMHFKSDEPSENIDISESPIVFYDIEVFPNLLLINWKYQGEGKPIVRMINPSPSEVEYILKFKLVGFNCRRYDNHILYARMMGYNIGEIYELSQKIINSQKGDRNNGLFGEAYNLSYTDIYDFASAGNKMSLKKLEIKMGIHHQELGLPWDQPVPEDMWYKVAEYCDNDVIATEAAFNYLSADWTARQILADLAGMTVNDTTNSLTTRIIFGGNKKPQNEACYRDLSKPVFDISEDVYEFLSKACPQMMSMTHGEAGSLLPYFPGYKYEFGKSTYRGEEVGEGGYVYAEPGMYGNVALLDIASMHPHSAIAECVFGPTFTKHFREIVEGRVSIKHEAWDDVDKMLDGKLTPYIQKVKSGEMTSKQLADALKTAINSVYGLTSARFENPFKNPLNVDNIVAKRGALFMINLKYEVQKRGFTVAHIKTDSIKIPDATPEIIKFVMDYGEQYGYTFEHEATYDRMCLVNNAVYIAKYKDGKHAGEWTATGKEFAVPYLYKTLFSHEPIEFEDMCETFAVSKGNLYLDMNEGLPDVTALEKEMEKYEKDYKKGLLSDTSFEKMCSEIADGIRNGHDLHFVGRVGQFTPVKSGTGGGVLYRVHEGKNYAAPGSTGYRWVESERLKAYGSTDNIDISFYRNLIDEAVEEISKYGDFEWFVSDDPYIPTKHPGMAFMDIPDGAEEELPFD